MKDLAKQETTEVIAVYVEYQTGNVHPGARRLFFENENNEFNLLAPVISKEHVKMEVGKTYIGTCRNASEAVWQGDHFIYQRYKWGSTFPEKINHFQNDDGYDVFVPIKLKE